MAARGRTCRTRPAGSAILDRQARHEAHPANLRRLLHVDQRLRCSPSHGPRPPPRQEPRHATARAHPAPRRWCVGVYCRGYQPLQTGRVDPVGRELELVAASAGDDLGVASVEQLAQVGHVERTSLCALGGARSSHRPSINRSVETVRLTCSASIASTARCCGGPSARGRPSKLASMGPRRRISMQETPSQWERGQGAYSRPGAEFNAASIGYRPGVYRPRTPSAA